MASVCFFTAKNCWAKSSTVSQFREIGGIVKVNFVCVLHLSEVEPEIALLTTIVGIAWPKADHKCSSCINPSSGLPLCRSYALAFKPSPLETK